MQRCLHLLPSASAVLLSPYFALFAFALIIRMTLSFNNDPMHISIIFNSSIHADMSERRTSWQVNCKKTQLKMSYQTLPKWQRKTNGLKQFPIVTRTWKRRNPAGQKETNLQEKMLQFLLRIRSTVEGDELKAVQVIGAKTTLVLRWVVAWKEKVKETKTEYESRTI